MASRKEFLAEIETIHGYKIDDWQPISKVAVPTGVAIFTMGKDEDGYFTHIQYGNIGKTKLLVSVKKPQNGIKSPLTIV